MNFFNIIIFSGAGLSQESGVKTFRDNDGLWENHRVEEVATPEAFKANPDLVYHFYNLRREQLTQVFPNDAHKSISEFQKKFKGKVHLITQNVDDLLERAGCSNVLHMHGELAKMRCQKSGRVFNAPTFFKADTLCECCKESASLRPHIVWFGEVPFHMDDIYRALDECDLFISVGTSNQVYPAASFVQYVKQKGITCWEVNFEPTQLSEIFDENYYGKAGVELPKILRKLAQDN